MKDFLLSVFIAFFVGVFGGGIPVGFEVTNWIVVALCTLVGAGLGTWFKESKRKSERPELWYVPYAIGAAVSLVCMLFVAHAQAASIAV